MSNQVTGVGGDGGFGANSWLVDELYEQFQKDRNSVDKEWWPILEQYTPDAAAQPAGDAPAEPAHPVTAPIPVIGAQPVARTTAVPPGTRLPTTVTRLGLSAGVTRVTTGCSASAGAAAATPPSARAAKAAGMTAKPISIASIMV